MTTLNVPQIILGKDSNSLNILSSSGVTAGALNIFVGTSTGTICSDLTLRSGISSDALSVYTSGSIYLTPGISFSTNSFMGSIYESGYNIYSGWTNVSTVALLAVTSFTSRVVPLDNIVQLFDITYSSKLNQFVMVSSTTYGFISNDAIIWNTVQVSSYSGGWSSVTWSDYLQLYCAVQTNNIVCSTDGIVWNTRLSVTGVWNNICWSNDLRLFCAVGNNGVVMISNDSNLWTTYSAMSSSYVLTDVCYSDQNNIFCVISSTTNPSNIISLSYNGILWNTYASAISSRGYNSICYSDELGLFGAVGGNGNIMTSTGGTSWISRTSPISDSFRTIIYSSELGLFIGLSFSYIVTSNDGINWISKTSPFPGTSQTCIWVGRNNKLYLISYQGAPPRFYDSVSYYNNLNNLTRIGTRGSTSNTLIDGNILKLGTGSLEVDIGYNAENINIGTSLYTNVNIYGNMNMLNSNISVYYSSISNTILPTIRSLATTNWTSGSLSTVDTIFFMTWVEEMGYFYCCDSFYIYRSNDGIKWMTVYAFGETVSGKFRIVWSPQFNLLFGLSTATPTYAFKSTDGVSWITEFVGINPVSYDYSNTVCWSEDLRIFCALPHLAGMRSLLIYTGLSYSTYVFNQSIQVNDICWTHELYTFVACSLQYIFNSYDGINWTTSYNDSNYLFFRITYSPKFSKIYMCGQGGGVGQIISSSDAKTWTLQSVFNLLTLYSIKWSNQLELFVIGSDGASNKIGYSYDGINWVTNRADSFNIRDISYSPKLSLFCCTTHNSTTVSYYFISNNAYPGINKQLTLGTQGSLSTTNLLGNQINIGNEGDIISIGNNAYNVNIGPLMNTININAPIYAPNNVLDVYNSGLGISSITGVQYLSVNTWTPVTSPATLNTTSTCWGDDLNVFVVLGRGGNNTSLTTMAYSYDGKIFNYITAPGGVWDSMCWSSELRQFLVVEDASGGTAKAMISNNGILWTTISQSVPGNVLNVCWSKGLYLYAASNYTGSPTIITSKDGISWTAYSNGAGTSGGYFAICWSQELGMFCATGDNLNNGFSPPRNFILTSYDGVLWTTVISPSSNFTWSGVCWSAELNLFCSVANNGAYSMRSSNGLTWTSSAAAIQCYRVCWAPQISLFLGAPNNNSSSAFMYSSDAIRWYTCRTSITSDNWRGISWSPKLSLFLVSSFNNFVQVSNNILPNISKSVTVGAEGITNINVTGNTLEIGKSSNLVEIGKYADRTLIYNQPLYYGFNSAIAFNTKNLFYYDISINNVPPGAYIAKLALNSIAKLTLDNYYALYIMGFNTNTNISISTLYVGNTFDPSPNLGGAGSYSCPLDFMNIINVTTYMNISYSMFTTASSIASPYTLFSTGQQRSFLLTPYY